MSRRVPLGFSELEVRKRQKSVGHCSIALVRSVGGEQQPAASAGAHQLPALNIDDVPMIIVIGSAHMSQVCWSGFGRRTGGDPAQYRQGPVSARRLRRALDACGFTGTAQPSDARRHRHAEHAVTLQQRQRLEMRITIQAQPAAA